MPDETTPPSRQPKLRSSCDACGIAKLRCDRGQPACGRCLSLGQTCIYGVSRKMGKPPRAGIRIPDMTGSSRVDLGKTYDHNTAGGSAGCFGRQSSNINRAGPSWSANDGYTDSSIMSDHEADGMPSHQLGPQFPDLSSLDFGDDSLSSILDSGAWPELEYLATPASQAMVSQTEVESSPDWNGSAMPPPGGRGHNCAHEASDILNCLSFGDLGMIHSTPWSTLPSAPATINTSHRLPLDHILRLNRESSERLSTLLVCSCARTSHLALLYASIISRILDLYRQAAGCSQRASWDPSAIVSDPATRHASVHGSSSEGWSSTAVTAVAASDGSTPAEAVVAPPRISMGSYEDDQQVQAALSVQLIFSEMRQTRHLVELFASRTAVGKDANVFAYADDLHENLSTWLRREHWRTTNAVNCRLQNVSPSIDYRAQ